MSVGKGGPHGGKTIDVRGFSLWVATQVTHPVVQIINRNKENIRMVISGESKGGEKGCNNG